MVDLEKVLSYDVQEGYMLFRGVILMVRRVVCCSGGLYAVVALAPAGNQIKFHGACKLGLGPG